MKHFTTLVILTLFLSSHLYSQALEELEKQIAAQNHVKTKIRFDYKYTSGEPAKKGVKSSTTSYNRSGDILRIDYYTAKGDITGSENYDYDANGNRILFERIGNSKYKKVSKYNDESLILLESGFNGAEEFRNEYRYTSGNKLSEITHGLGGHTQQKIVYTYSGNVADVGIYANGTSLSSKMKMVFDSRNNLLEETTYSVDGKEIDTKKYTYNSASQLLEEMKTTEGKFYYRISNVYDAEGRLVAVAEETLSKKKYVKKEYIYDGEGNLIAYKWRRNPGEDFNIKSYTYNSKGVCLTEHTYYPQTKFELLSRFEYEYY